MVVSIKMQLNATETSKRATKLMRTSSPERWKDSTLLMS
jgi:hypothetical protein